MSKALPRFLQNTWVHYLWYTMLPCIATSASNCPLLAGMDTSDLSTVHTQNRLQSRTRSTAIDSPDQRIAEDVDNFTSYSLTLLITILTSLVFGLPFPWFCGTFAGVLCFDRVRSVGTGHDVDWCLVGGLELLTQLRGKQLRLPGPMRTIQNALRTRGRRYYEKPDRGTTGPTRS
jgi:hypothetical protein